MGLDGMGLLSLNRLAIRSPQSGANNQYSPNDNISPKQPKFSKIAQNCQNSQGDQNSKIARSLAGRCQTRFAKSVELTKTSVELSRKSVEVRRK